MKIFERNDRKCRAVIHALNNGKILITAFWPTRKGDDRNKMRNDGLTYNTLHLNEADFNARYKELSA